MIKKTFKRIKKLFKLTKFKLFYRNKGPVENKEVAIVMFGGLGDGVIALPFIKQVVDLHGKNNVVLFCNRPLLQLFKDYSTVAEVCVFNVTERYSDEWFEFIKTLKKYKFNKLIDLNYSRETVKNGYVVKNISAKEKIGIKGDVINMLKPHDIDKFYTKLIKVEENKHESINLYNFLSAIGYSVESDLFYLKKYVERKSVHKKPYVVFAMGASLEYRIWPINKWVKIAEEILKTTDKDIIICGSEKESVYYNKLQQEINSERIINACGKTSLAELINLLGNCDFAIANDSGPAHIVASTGSKGIVLLGGGFNHRFFPHIDHNNNATNIRIVESKKGCFGCKWLCSSEEKFCCIKDIDVNDVLKEIKEISNN